MWPLLLSIELQKNSEEEDSYFVPRTTYGFSPFSLAYIERETIECVNTMPTNERAIPRPGDRDHNAKIGSNTDSN